MKMQERIYQSYLRSAMLYGSETWCLRENEMAILRKVKKAMMRAMHKVKVIEKRTSQELMSLLSLKDTLDGLTRASRVRWYGHILRKVLRTLLDFEVAGKRGCGRPNINMEETSGGAYQSDWTEKGGCH